MKKFITNLLIFVVAVAIGDFVLGGALGQWRSHHSKGTVGNLEYAYRSCHDDILIFGPSRAAHHYVPRLLDDSLHLSSFNMGRDAMGILYHYGVWSMVRQYHKPRLIIYEFSQVDYFHFSDNKIFTKELRPYMDVPGVAEVVEEVDSTEQVKTLSQLYRNNSQFFEIFFGDRMFNEMEKGYEPYYGHLDKAPEVEPPTYTLCPMKLRFLEKFIQQTQADHVQLVFMISPFFLGDFQPYPAEVVQLFEKYHVTYYNNSCLPGFTGNKALFISNKHLNNVGAERYTRAIVPQIREVISPKTE